MNTPAPTIQPAKEVKIGVIPTLLIKDEVLTHDQLAYAARVYSKLTTPQTMLDTLLELGLISQEQLQTTLRKHQLNLRLGDLLLELGYLREIDLQQALAIQKDAQGQRRLGDVLVDNGFIEERKLLETLSYQLGYPLIDPDFVKIDKTLLARLPLNICQQFNVLPLYRQGEQLVVTFADPLDQRARDIVSSHLGNFIPAICSKKSLKEALAALEHAGQTIAADDNTIIGMINLLFEDAIEEQASDIHIEPQKDRLRVRFRRDGVMGHYKDFPKEIAPQLTTRIKVMASADIAEKRRHQDGRILFASRKHGINLDLRVSFFITIYGEKVVLRLLNNKGTLLDIKEVGMAPRMLEHFIYDALEVPTGVMIVTGPTGSGKTTTLYGCVNHLNDINTSIITAEDPVEYVIDGISQCSINPKIGVTFEETLRHIVRQDPDVIVLGEIRDQFSAEVAIQAALTGHKVLTTFHTEDSIGGLIRLMNMNIEAFLISSTVVCIVAQRLLRKVCPECAEPYTPTPLDLTRLGLSANDLQGAEFKLGRGCKNCRFSGYRGRVAIFELLVMNEMVKNAILDHKSSYEIRKISVETSGMVTLMEDGLVKGARGLISMQEIVTDLPRLGKPRPLHELRRILGVQR
ncbi:type IV pilus assembly protein PilB [Trichlorobacter thiogenes]|uniref:Type IV pilus assembly protein PilB n=1 Tax=Trichlorobacter thiogenes TaxID=115783 RepID=A0A1T4NGI9_9BACT|nr:GspE/PulE family protein [Trichlorobacter thiogenes]SJZ78137.1 type IV pilus assembly protein PilB [Trichlorobacter thiogenes]